MDFRPLTPEQRRQLFNIDSTLKAEGPAAGMLDSTDPRVVRATEEFVAAVCHPPGREWPLLTLAVIVRLVLVAALLGGAAAAAVWLTNW